MPSWPLMLPNRSMLVLSSSSGRLPRLELKRMQLGARSVKLQSASDFRDSVSRIFKKSASVVKKKNSRKSRRSRPRRSKEWRIERSRGA